MEMHSFLSHIQSNALFNSWKGVGYAQFLRLDAQLRQAEHLLNVQCCMTAGSRAFAITCTECGHQARGAYGTHTSEHEKKAAMEALTTMFLGEALSQEQSGNV